MPWFLIANSDEYCFCVCFILFIPLQSSKASLAQGLEHWSCKPGVERSNLSRGGAWHDSFLFSSYQSTEPFRFPKIIETYGVESSNLSRGFITFMPHNVIMPTKTNIGVFTLWISYLSVLIPNRKPEVVRFTTIHSLFSELSLRGSQVKTKLCSGFANKQNSCLMSFILTPFSLFQ